MIKILLITMGGSGLLQACQKSTNMETEAVSLSLETSPDSVQLFAVGIVSTRYNERDMAISANGDKDYCLFIDFPRKTFYFTSNRSPAHQNRIENVGQLKTESDKTLNGLDNIYHVKMNLLK